MRTTQAQAERTKQSWQEADPAAREAWLAKLRAAAQRPDVRAKRAAAAREASAKRAAFWMEWACRKYGLTPEEVPRFRKLRNRLADATRAARIVKGMRADPPAMTANARRALEKYGLTPDELEEWRFIKGKTRMRSAEAAEVVIRSRKGAARCG